MKKSLALLLFLLSVVLCFTSCDFLKAFKEPTNGIMLDRMASKKLTEVASYTATDSIKAKIPTYDTDIYISAESITTVAGQNTPDFVSNTETEHMTTYKKRSTKEETTQKTWITEGYQDGYMFRTHMHDFNILRKKSPISADDYVEFLSKRQEVGLKEFFNSFPQKNELVLLENGDRKAILSEFKSEYVNDYFNRIMGYSIPCGTRPTALTVTITTTNDCIYKSIVIDFELHTPEYAENTLESLSIVTEFSNVNSTVAYKEDIDIYKNVSDLRLFYTVSDAINDFGTYDYGEFNMNYSFECDYRGLSRDETITLYFDKRDRLSYVLGVKDGYKTIVTEYSNGEAKQTTYDPDLNYEDPPYLGNLDEILADMVKEYFSSEYEETAAINSLFNYAEFSIDDIKEVKISEDDESTYILDLYPPQGLLAKTGGRLNSVTVTVTLHKGKITKYSIDAQGEGYYNGSHLTFTLKTEASYLYQ